MVRKILMTFCLVLSVDSALAMTGVNQIKVCLASGSAIVIGSLTGRVVDSVFFKEKNNSYRMCLISTLFFGLVFNSSIGPIERWWRHKERDKQILEKHEVVNDVIN